MPKNIHTPRDELICGKIDVALEIAIKHQDIKLLDALVAIRSDAERMEAKLVSRKDEVAALQQKPAVLEGERAVALADLNYFEKFMATVPPDGYVMKDFFRPPSLETIKAALQSSAVEALAEVRKHLREIRNKTGRQVILFHCNEIEEILDSIEVVGDEEFVGVAMSSVWQKRYIEVFKAIKDAGFLVLRGKG